MNQGHYPNQYGNYAQYPHSQPPAQGGNNMNHPSQAAFHHPHNNNMNSTPPLNNGGGPPQQLGMPLQQQAGIKQPYHGGPQPAGQYPNHTAPPPQQQRPPSQQQQQYYANNYRNNLSAPPTTGAPINNQAPPSLHHQQQVASTLPPPTSQQQQQQQQQINPYYQTPAVSSSAAPVANSNSYADRLAWPNASKANVPVTAPPKAGQPYQPQQKPVVGPPPMAGQPYQPQQKPVVGPPPMAGQPHQPQQNSISGPPLMPGQPQPKVVGPPPMTGQAYQPQTISGPPSMPLMPGQPQPKVVGPPPMAGQAYQPQQGGQQQQQQLQNNSSFPNYMPGHQQQPPAPGGAGNASISGINQNMRNLQMKDRPINLMTETRILPKEKEADLPIRYENSTTPGQFVPPDRQNCHPDVMRCTLKSVPQSQNLLTKVKLPFGIVVHPFKDLCSLPVISAGSIVRCRRCRTYINPFVSFSDERKWRCNMCFALNEAPEEFLLHPVNKSYGMPHTRPECTNSTIEFIAPQEYMLRPPQPAVYLILLDVSHAAIETGYLQLVCDTLLEYLDQLPGDLRTMIGFITYNRTLHFYRFSEGATRPEMMVVSDVDDIFLPTEDNLMANLNENKEQIEELLRQLPQVHSNDQVGTEDTYSALGAALEAGFKLVSNYGGRISVFQQSIPSVGPGKLQSREDPNSRAGQKVDTALINASTDYYKKMALESITSQVAIDFFFMNSQYLDISTLSCASRFSGGDVHYYPGLHVKHNPMEVERFMRDLDRYFTRKIGFESVMRVRCSKGLTIHNFHGNCFVRSNDLMVLANINPDAGFAAEVKIEESLTDISSVCFQAALLYTSSKGERRIRIHTICLPVVKTAQEVIENVDCVAAVTLLSKMAVRKAMSGSLLDSRDALMNALIDLLKVYKECAKEKAMLPTSGNGVFVPPALRLFPLYIHALLKHPSLRVGISTSLDQRVYSMLLLGMQPAKYLMQSVHPDLYRVDNLPELEETEAMPDLLPLSSEYISKNGAYLLDCGWSMYLLIGRMCHHEFIKQVLDESQFSDIKEPMYFIPELENEQSKGFSAFIEHLQESRPHHAPIRVIRDDVRERHLFMSHMLQDRTESSTSLQEFLMHLSQKVNAN